MNTAMIECGKALCRELGRAVNGKSSHDEPLPPADEAMAFCDAHQLHALCASALSLRGTLPAAYDPLLASGMKRTAAQIKTDAIEDTLSRCFTTAGIAHIVLKGSHTRRFYPDALSRTSADIDWQIDPADSELADALLLENGWSLKSADDDERCYEKPPRSRLELHLAPEGFYRAQQDVTEHLLRDTVVAQGLRFHLCDSAAYVYAVFHLYKHFVVAGAGVRMFLDVFAIAAHGTLDRAYINERLTALGCRDFEKRVQQINAVLFDGADSDEEIDTLIHYVFLGRAYGVNTIQLALEPLTSRIANRSPLADFARNYGFAYPMMEERYPCLKRTKVLYPFCALHRIAHGLRVRRTVLRRAINDRQLSRDCRDKLAYILELASIK